MKWIARWLGPGRIYGLKLLLAINIINLPDSLLAYVSLEKFLQQQGVINLTVDAQAQTIINYINIGVLVGLFLIWVLNWQKLFRFLCILYASWVTVRLLFDVTGMVVILLSNNPAEVQIKTSGVTLFRDGAVLWISNVLLYSVWYWLLDGGGSLERRDPRSRPDFAFPQQSGTFPHWENWYPRYLDYLFLAFNTSTAISPTDTVVLSHRAKVLMMIQAGTSLIVLAVLASRAINLLQ